MKTTLKYLFYLAIILLLYIIASDIYTNKLKPSLNSESTTTSPQQ